MYSHVGDWCVLSLAPSLAPPLPLISSSPTKRLHCPSLSPSLPSSLPFRDTSKKPRENLEALLGLAFPAPPAAANASKEGKKEERWQQEYAEECCICYAYQSEGEEGKEGGGRQGGRAGGRMGGGGGFTI